MKKIFKDTNSLTSVIMDTDNIKYEITVEDYESIDGYAKCLIIDRTNNERYHSYGYIQINNSIIITKWGTDYNNRKDNYVYTRDLIVEIL